MSYQNKTIWITGASAGIGEALAYGYSKEGANLILSSRKKDQLEKVKTNCEKKGAGTVWVVPIDLAKYEKIESIVSETIAQVGNIDVLINNGGISQRSLVTETSLEVDQRIMAVNFFGSVAMTKAVLPNMKKNNRGNIVAVSSVAGKIGPPLRSAYASSKHAVAGFFDVLRLELMETNIKVTVFYPGYIRTDISKNALTKDGTPHSKMDDNQEQGMSVEVFAQKAIRAIQKGKYEVVIGGAETLTVYLKRFFPSLLFRILKKEMKKYLGGYLDK